MHIVHGRAAGARAQARGETFTGTVYGDPVLPTTDAVAVNSVTFTPCARTYWHHHERGQLLIVTAGSGWVCAHGDDPQPVAVGDHVWTAPGERHWHGAGPRTILTHTAISLGATTWLDEVSAGDYAGVTRGAGA